MVIENSDIGSKLDILIKLQAANVVDRFETQKEKILFLYSLGLDARTIADALGTTRNTVSVAISNSKGKTKGVKSAEK